MKTINRAIISYKIQPHDRVPYKAEKAARTIKELLTNRNLNKQEIASLQQELAGVKGALQKTITKQKQENPSLWRCTKKYLFDTYLGRIILTSGAAIAMFVLLAALNGSEEGSVSDINGQILANAAKATMERAGLSAQAIRYIAS